ncbi:trypsin-like peptidase domain-containing protein [Paludisphaera sp.]|uniref:trypsin-like peptidase domain-containing protein n=1 Tax=Paludisphaera sp. TaxID=2017432 RepID=UPI00301BE46D
MPPDRATGPARVWRRRISGLALCGILLAGMVVRLWETYLPPSPERPFYAPGGQATDPAVAFVRPEPIDPHRLEERVRETARAVLPAVVAVASSSDGPSAKDYASGVIVTADGLVLSQWHVSHKNESQGVETSRTPGDRTTIILHDGRERPAELLGADRSHDVSLLRLLDPGPHPHVPIRPEVPVAAGDWVLKIGHPLGYQKGRPAPVRLGRVTWGTAELFGAESMVVGGDSGGPYFDLDGRLLGILCGTNGYPARRYRDDMDAFQRAGQFALCRVTGVRRIDSLLDAMLGGEVAPDDGRRSERFERVFAASPRLRPADFTQGPASLARYRSAVEPARESVVAMLNEGVAVGLGTIVGAEGWVVAKASVLPPRPTCRLPGGRVATARVVGVDPAFDLALLAVPATGLRPVRWADDLDPQAGTILAAVGAEGPLAVGVVSVPRRHLEVSARPAEPPPLRLPAGPPYIGGAWRTTGGWSLRAAIGLSREGRFHVANVEGLAYSAGVRPDDLLVGLNGRSIAAVEDMLNAVDGLRSGDVVPVRLERAGRTMDLALPLGPDSYGDQNNHRADGFPTVIECAIPFYSYECGGPVVDLEGRAVGVTIARTGAHGGMIAPGDRVRKLLSDLKGGRPTDGWARARTPGG